MTAIIIDTECTGLKEPQVIEYGEASFQLDEIGEVKVTRIKPSKPIEPGAMATHGIIEEDLVNCPNYDDFIFEVPEYIIGHNIDYDWGSIKKPDCKRICTLALARSLWPKENHKLLSLVFFLSKEKGREFFNTAHSVKTDVEACGFLLQEMCNILKPQSIEELYQMSENARIPELMYFGKHTGMKISDVPASYVRWYLDSPNPDPYVVKAMRQR